MGFLACREELTGPIDMLSCFTPSAKSCGGGVWGTNPRGQNRTRFLLRRARSPCGQGQNRTPGLPNTFMGIKQECQALWDVATSSCCSAGAGTRESLYPRGHPESHPAWAQQPRGPGLCLRLMFQNDPSGASSGSKNL